MRFVLGAVVLLFTAMIAVLTVLDIVRHGVSWLNVLAILIVILFATGIIGALWTPPRE
jgi:cytochrome c biogenesis protein CcdA